MTNDVNNEVPYSHNTRCLIGVRHQPPMRERTFITEHISGQKLRHRTIIECHLHQFVGPISVISNFLSPSLDQIHRREYADIPLDGPCPFR